MNEACPIAPEICVEVLSASNTHAEIDERKQLYFEKGALELWTCDMKGRMRFFDPNGELPTSNILPEFPKEVE